METYTIRSPSADGSLMGLRCDPDGTLVYFHATIADRPISGPFAACDAIGKQTIPAEVLAQIKIRYNLVSNRPAEKSSADQEAGLGPQLWESCQRCGSEPSYARRNGHLCRACRDAGHDHPRIPGPGVPTFPTEPDGG